MVSANFVILRQIDPEEITWIVVGARRRPVWELCCRLLRASGYPKDCVERAETGRARQYWDKADPTPGSLWPNEDKGEENETDQNAEDTLDGVFGNDQEILHETSEATLVLSIISRPNG